jgi:hypothetical protein
MEEQSYPCCLVISQSYLLSLLVLVGQDSPSCFGSSLFFLRNIFWVPHQVRPSSFIARARFFRQFFSLRCPFSLLKIFVSAEGFFLPVIPRFGVLVGFAARLRSCPNQRQEPLRFA